MATIISYVTYTQRLHFGTESIKRNAKVITHVRN